MSSVAPEYDVARVFEAENTQFAAGAGAGISKVLMGLGAVLIALTFLIGITADNDIAGVTKSATALHAFHTGFMLVLSFTLGALGIHLFCSAVKAGWWVTMRKQVENVMSLMWLPAILFILVVVMQLIFVAGQPATDKLNGIYAPFLWNWMDAKYVAGDTLYEGKSAYLNIPFFAARALLFFGIWLGLTALITNISKAQDRDGSKWHTATMQRVAVIGLPFFAFSLAFAGFDWVMSLDHHWFSTMFGVYMFAGNTMATLALLGLIMLTLRSRGKLHGAYTNEHLHDHSKLFFAFIVFWAYITFSQYFLIWYAAIPEEAAWFEVRKENWHWLSVLLPVGHFVIPFLVFLPRPNRRNPMIVSLVCIWMLIMHVADMYWNIRPEVKPYSIAASVSWIDILGVGGPLLIFAGLLIRKVASSTLLPLNDPRTTEALDHKNYV